ncbi:hypothetical protein BJ138DRAFT_1144613 [Hygrophoropsis aurantiaca]|uniref:Uncharacterized protein n=1 Tax=Hygrophoropsis aurantiaca TaxID=72124 RepID=A0ACB8ALH1_9AGAM|nr:hypothetical protein BJ138DRAFT_1144613 [Hygrophoropsis aurantiaca]
MATITIAGGTLVKLSTFYGAMYWGFVLSTSLVGISLVQVYMYYMRYNNDRWQMKALVVSLLILDPATSILMAETIYYYFVVNFGVPQALASVPISWVLETGLTVLLTSIVQVYFAIKIYMIHRQSAAVPGGILIPLAIFVLAIAAFAAGTVTTVLSGVYSIMGFAEIPFQIAVITEETFAAAADVITMTTLCYVLAPPRTGVATGRSSRLKFIFLYLVNRGILVTLIQIGMLAGYLVARTQLYWMPFHLCKSKLYTNTLLAMLNSQAREVRRFGEATRSLAPWGIPVINISMKEEGGIGFPSVSTAEADHDAEKSAHPAEEVVEIPEYPPSTSRRLSAGPS